MPHKFLFTGEDTYSLHQELQKWKQAFLSKYGDQAFFRFSPDELDASELLNVIQGGGMFSSKKLIIVHGVPKDNGSSHKVLASKLQPVEEMLMKHRESIPEDHVLILVCSKPDKRTKGWKFFEKHAEVKKFNPLKEKDLVAFVHGRLDGLVTIAQSELIVQLVGTSTRNIAHECDKLKLYASYNSFTKLTDEQIETVVFHQGEMNAFGVLDTLFSDKEKTIEQLTQLKKQGQDIFQTLGMMYRGIKLVLQIVDSYEHGHKSGKEIASAIKAHPFAVNKQLKNIKTLQAKKSHIRNLFKELLDIDSSIKSGKLPAEGFWVQLKKSVYKM